ncbi:MAG: hypothetical protein H6907_03945 [Hyphomicrobiales bacterium]|nr:hypothetical protein [Hyphomicrobiales bacterium]MCP5370862.1 hypothetical protein [Hyphomicrobiales bacterium]
MTVLELTAPLHGPVRFTSRLVKFLAAVFAKREADEPLSPVSDHGRRSAGLSPEAQMYDWGHMGGRR